MTFDATQLLQRPGLVLDMNVPGHPDGVVFAGFGSTHDAEPYHGWVVGWDAKTLQQLYVFNATPNGYGGSFWQSGGGLVALDDGSLVVTSANGAFDAQTTTAPGPNALGFAGYGLGFGGLDHSAAVPISDVIPGNATPSTGLWYNGVIPGPKPLDGTGTFVKMDQSQINFTRGATDQAGPHEYRVTLSYDGTDLTEHIEDTTTHATFDHVYKNANLQQAVGGGSAYIGIGSSTDARRSDNYVTGWTVQTRRPDAGGRRGRLRHARQPDGQRRREVRAEVLLVRPERAGADRRSHDQAGVRSGVDALLQRQDRPEQLHHDLHLPDRRPAGRRRATGSR